MNKDYYKLYSEGLSLPSGSNVERSGSFVKNIPAQPDCIDRWLNQFAEIQREGVYLPALDFKQSSERESSFFIQKLERQSRLLLAFSAQQFGQNLQKDKKANSFSQSGSLDCKCANPVQVQVESLGNQITLTIKIFNNINSNMITKE